jgi:hypothetical protein
LALAQVPGERTDLDLALAQARDERTERERVRASDAVPREPVDRHEA